VKRQLYRHSQRCNTRTRDNASTPRNSHKYQWTLNTENKRLSEAHNNTDTISSLNTQLSALQQQLSSAEETKQLLEQAAKETDRTHRQH